MTSIRSKFSARPRVDLTHSISSATYLLTRSWRFRGLSAALSKETPETRAREFGQEFDDGIEMIICSNITSRQLTIGIVSVAGVAGRPRAR
jgi:hypothetical protein